MVVGLDENEEEKINEGCKKLDDISPVYYLGAMCEWVGDILKIKCCSLNE